MTGNKVDFWRNSTGRILALAPMEDVTDTVFREIVMSLAEPGNLEVVFTEFISVDGLCHPVGRKAVIHRLHVNDSERALLKKKNIKLVAQLWGTDPLKFSESGRFISESFIFDGIDINMGCPVDKIVKHGACSALIDQPTLALEIIDATIRASGLPVSVKTRTGIKDNQTERWIGELLQSKLSAITLHARTQKMQSLYPADWEQIALAVKIRDRINPGVKLLGNGDVGNLKHAFELMDKTNADGVMIGRGIFADPWLFGNRPDDISINDRLSILTKHIKLYNETWKSTRNFSILKRFFKIYITGFAGAALLRASLMKVDNSHEAIAIIESFEIQNSFGQLTD